MNGKKDSYYSYDAINQLTAYTGYDGYQTKYTYDAAGMMSAKESKGNASRLTLEEIIEGKDEPAEESDDPDPADEWVKTSYIYDITTPYYEVLQETANGKTTSYDYGIERIAAHTSDFWSSHKTEYVYDGRGSVAEELTYNNSWYTWGGVLSPTTKVTKSYTPFGEQLNEKLSGFGFNGEYYDSATGMINLRARQYEPAMNRFSQKDILKGDASSPMSLNRYLYVENDPVNFADPSGMSLADLWSDVKNFVKSTASTIVKGVSSYVSKKVEKASNIAGTVVGWFNKDKGDKIKAAGKTVALVISDNGNKLANSIYPISDSASSKSPSSGSKAKSAGSNTKNISPYVTPTSNKKQKDDAEEARNDALSDALIEKYNLENQIDKAKLKGMTSQEKLKYVCELAAKTNKNRNLFDVLLPATRNMTILFEVDEFWIMQDEEKTRFRKDHWEAAKDPFGGLLAYNTSKQAIQYSVKKYGDQKDGTRQNALQHALWNALMTYDMDEQKAKKFADAHEVLAGDVNKIEKNGNTRAENTNMDLYYNELGRKAAIELIEQKKKMMPDGTYRSDITISEMMEYVDSKIEENQSYILEEK